MPEEKQQSGGSGSNPMEEENFPVNNPTRRAADKHMDEPSNIRPPTKPTPSRMRPSPVEGDEQTR